MHFHAKLLINIKNHPGNIFISTNNKHTKQENQRHRQGHPISNVFLWRRDRTLTSIITTLFKNCKVQ